VIGFRPLRGGEYHAIRDGHVVGWIGREGDDCFGARGWASWDPGELREIARFLERRAGAGFTSALELVVDPDGRGRIMRNSVQLVLLPPATANVRAIPVSLHSEEFFSAGDLLFIADSLDRDRGTECES
jgi:hypothetical protein